MKPILLVGALAWAALPLCGQDSQMIYAQKLVDEAMTKHPDVVIFAMH